MNSKHKKLALKAPYIVSSLLILSVLISMIIAALSSKRGVSSASSVIAKTEQSSQIATIETISSEIARVESVYSIAEPSKIPSTVSYAQTVSKSAPQTDTAVSWAPPVIDSSDSYFNDVLFVGDSITTGIDLYGVVKNAAVVAYTGINTNTVMTSKVIRSGNSKVTFLEAMSWYKPNKIYMMFGINGIAFQTKNQFISGYRNFLNATKKQHPNAVIYVQSILPVTDKKQKKDSRFANTKIDSYNEALKQLAEECGVYYLDVAHDFKDGNGNLPNAASSDGIHFGTAYYKIWINYIKNHILHEQETVSPPSEDTTTSIAPIEESTPMPSEPPVSSTQSIVSIIFPSRPPKE